MDKIKSEVIVKMAKEVQTKMVKGNDKGPHLNKLTGFKRSENECMQGN